MKKLIVTLVIALGFALTATAQDRSVVVRSGNTYYVDQVSYSKKGFKTFLKDNCMQGYAKFNSGYKISIAGWVCFGAGIALESAGFGMAFGSGMTANPSMAQASAVCFYTGAAALTASIPLLAVGYSRMHNTTDIYNSVCSQPKATLSLDATSDGIGLGLKF